MKNSYSKILLIALLTHLLLIFFGPYIVMNQLDRNIADAIANPYEGCEDTYDGIVGNLDQVCISRRSAARMPNYDLFTQCAGMTCLMVICTYQCQFPKTIDIGLFTSITTIQT